MTLLLNLNKTNTLTRLNNNINLELLEAYKRQLDLSNTSKDTYINCVRHFINYLEAHEIEEPTEDTIIMYKNYLKANYSTSTTNTHLTSIKSFYNFLEKKGFINVARGIKGSKTSKNFKRDCLTIEQIKSISNAINLNTLEGLRDYAIFRLMVTSGLRSCEVVNCQIKDIRTIGNKNVLFIQGKGHTEKDDFIILEARTLNAINEYLAKRKPNSTSDPLFSSLSNNNKNGYLTTRALRGIIKQLYKNAGIFNENITTHSTRHTAITLCLVATNGNIQEAQQLARHTNINTTMIYSHNLNKLNSNTSDKIASLID